MDPCLLQRHSEVLSYMNLKYRNKMSGLIQNQFNWSWEWVLDSMFTSFVTLHPLNYQ